GEIRTRKAARTSDARKCRACSDTARLTVARPRQRLELDLARQAVVKGGSQRPAADDIREMERQAARAVEQDHRGPSSGPARSVRKHERHRRVAALQVERSDSAAHGKSDGYCAFGRTLTWTGRIIAPGPGSPDVMLTVADCVGAMQKVAASAPLWPSVARFPERSMVPPFRVGKHGTLVLLEQHTCEMPPLGSMHCPSAVLAMHALPVQAAVQVPAPQASSCV